MRRRMCSRPQSHKKHDAGNGQGRRVESDELCAESRWRSPFRRATPPDVATVADLAKSGVKVALCQMQVPCGATAEKVFANAKVVVKPVTREADVKATLTKVELKEVDAGVVYVTDVKSAGSKVIGIVIPADINASTEYPIAALTKAPNAAGAKAFVDYVLSAPAQQVLTAAGFRRPEDEVAGFRMWAAGRSARRTQPALSDQPASWRPAVHRCARCHWACLSGPATCRAIGSGALEWTPGAAV